MKLKNVLKVIFISILFLNSFSLLSFATQLNIKMINTNLSKNLNNWMELSEDEKRENSLGLDTYSIKYNRQNTKKLENETYVKLTKLIGSESYLNSKYCLTDDIDVKVKNQGNTNHCWAFSTLSAMETNMKLSKNEDKDFSERHMVYATSENFIDGINEKGFNKAPSDGGNAQIAMAYLTNGQGAVLEEKMPFEDNEDEINLESINIEQDTYVAEYVKFPSIYKSYDNNGNVIYEDDFGEKYSTEDVNQIRNLIKKHIVKYGGVTSTTCGSQIKYYNNQEDPRKSTAFFCDDVSKMDHAITIVGWDDNYSRENFNESCRPKTNGAYIVLNSYGKEMFDNGYIYISYEDALIETILYGIVRTDNKKFDNLYQYDYYGGVFSIDFSDIKTGYYANIFDKDENRCEKLEKIGITIPEFASLNIYVNPNGDNLEKNNLTKVASTSELEPGYHTIDVDDIYLEKDKFAIAVEQISSDNNCSLLIESYFPNSVFENVVSETTKNKISIDGKNWENLADEGNVGYIDLTKSDFCIKAFTNNEEKPVIEEKITSSKYTINETYIKNIIVGTTLSQLKENISGIKTIEVLKNNVPINDNDILATGMKIIINNKEYNSIVIGDLNGDGKISLLDISKLVLHYSEDPKYRLNEEFMLAGDLNQDEKISLLDISKLIILYNEI